MSTRVTKDTNDLSSFLLPPISCLLPPASASCLLSTRLLISCLRICDIVGAHAPSDRRGPCFRPGARGHLNRQPRAGHSNRRARTAARREGEAAPARTSRAASRSCSSTSSVWTRWPSSRRTTGSSFATAIPANRWGPGWASPRVTATISSTATREFWSKRVRRCASTGCCGVIFPCRIWRATGSKWAWRPPIGTTRRTTSTVWERAAWKAIG